jgi:hypothetical protein
MRPLAWSTLVISTILASSPALAQMYDPRYPVCMQVYDAVSTLATAPLMCDETASDGASSPGAWCRGDYLFLNFFECEQY